MSKHHHQSEQLLDTHTLCPHASRTLLPTESVKDEKCAFQMPFCPGQGEGNMGPQVRTPNLQILARKCPQAYSKLLRGMASWPASLGSHTCPQSTSLSLSEAPVCRAGTFHRVGREERSRTSCMTHEDKGMQCFGVTSRKSRTTAYGGHAARRTDCMTGRDRGCAAPSCGSVVPGEHSAAELAEARRLAQGGGGRLAASGGQADGNGTCPAHPACGTSCCLL